jgi:guanylate kinase
MSSSPVLPDRGQLWVVSAPSGTGKTTVVDRLMEQTPRLQRSRSYTSRPARPGEVDGVDYNFVSRQAFEAMIREDAFLEWADIFGNLYGTSRAETEAALVAGIDLILVIDVQGARQVRARMPEATAIFVLPPSFEILASRLRGRNKDPETSIVRRLATARDEIDAVDEYDYVVVNDELERCVVEIDAIIAAERARLPRRRASIMPILATFKV